MNELEINQAPILISIPQNLTEELKECIKEPDEIDQSSTDYLNLILAALKVRFAQVMQQTIGQTISSNVGMMELSNILAQYGGNEFFRQHLMTAVEHHLASFPAEDRENFLVLLDESVKTAEPLAKLPPVSWAELEKIHHWKLEELVPTPSKKHLS